LAKADLYLVFGDVIVAKAEGNGVGVKV
jgi:hypothetical protein